MKINVGTFKGPPECTLAPNNHQNGAKEVPQDLKMPPKWCPRRCSKKVGKKGAQIEQQAIQKTPLCNIPEWGKGHSTIIRDTPLVSKGTVADHVDEGRSRIIVRLNTSNCFRNLSVTL